MSAHNERVPGSPGLAVTWQGRGDAVLFLHGIGGNRTNWSREVMRFGQDRLALSLDFRGYGDSEDPSGPLDFFDLVDDVARVMAHFGLDRADVVGLSMGGLVAQALYARAPDRVRSLCLVACRPGSEPVADAEAGSSFVEERRGPILAGGAAALADSLAPKLVGSGASPTAIAEIRASLLALRPDAYLRMLEARVALRPFLDLASVTVPVLVVAGTDDKVAPPPQMTALAAALPDSRLAILDRAGHLLNIEQPDRFGRILAGFLEEVRSGDARRKALSARMTSRPVLNEEVP